MAKLDWEKAKREGTARRRPKGSVRSAYNKDRAVELLKFVGKHDLDCFSCGSTTNEWAKTGTNRYGPWAICVPCVQSDKRGSGRP
jgi:hypothetical protein